jgi:hypothetical protein
VTASHLPPHGGLSPAVAVPGDASSAYIHEDRSAATPDGLSPRAQRLLALTTPEPLQIRWRWVVLGALILAGLFTLIFRGAPTYDPWAWIIWGREIIHGDLVTTSGPSWKPLPMLFTIPFAVFGDIAPDLWMWVARASALVGIVAVADLASRLGGRLAAGLAGVAIALAPLYYAYGVQGSSEGALVLVCCLSATSWLDDHKDRAFWWLVAAALLRPEAWPFVAALGIQRLWTNPKRLWWLVAAAVIVIVAWLVPEKIGSGSFMRAATRAHDPNPESAAFAKSPTLDVLGSMGNLLLWVPAIGVCLALVFGIVAWRQSDERRPIPKTILRTAAFLGLLAFAWVAIVAAMTEGGYAGNPRYLAAPLGFLVALSLGGVAWLVRELARRGGSSVAELLIMAALVLLVTVAALRLPGRTEEITWQATNRAELRDLEASVPGLRAKLLSCPSSTLRQASLFAHPLMVPPIAWTFDLHIDQVLSDDPPQRTGVFVVGTNAHSRPLRPRLDLVNQPVTELAKSDQIRIVTNCAP